MPQLIYLIAAEKMILDQDEQTVSFVSLLDRLMAHVKSSEVDESGVRLKDKTVLPMHWSVSTLWEADKEDIDSQFEQRMLLISPDGQQTEVVQTIPFQFRAERIKFRVHHKVRGFPIPMAGTYRVVISLRWRRPKSNRWTEWRDLSCTYPIIIDFEVTADVAIGVPKTKSTFEKLDTSKSARKMILD